MDSFQIHIYKILLRFHDSYLSAMHADILLLYCYKCTTCSSSFLFLIGNMVISYNMPIKARNSIIYVYPQLCNSISTWIFISTHFPMFSFCNSSINIAFLTQVTSLCQLPNLSSSQPFPPSSKYW